MLLQPGMKPHPLGVVVPLALALALPLAAAGCSASGAGEPPPRSSRATAAAPAVGGPVTGARARALVASGATLLDVRSAEEWGDGHLDGAVNIPVAELPARVGELPRDRPVVVYCRSGNRSKQAVAQLVGAGLEAVDLGAMRAW